MHLVQSMAYVGETPWHGLGSQLAPNQPLEIWAHQAGMNWRIEEAEVRFVSGNAGSGLGSIHAFPEQKVLYRSDTRAPLSVVSSRYQVVQPAEILEFYRDLTEVGGFGEFSGQGGHSGQGGRRAAWRPGAANARFHRYLSFAVCHLSFCYWNRSFTSLLAALNVEAASAPFR